MTLEPSLIDSDVLSLLSRGHPAVSAFAADYLHRFGRLTLSAVTVFERLRGYRDAIRRGLPFEPQMRQFEALAAASLVLPVDARVADVAARIWAHASRARRRALGDILIAATASANALPLATRNRRDFDALGKAPGVALRLVDWTR